MGEKANNFSKYLNEKMEQHGVSVAKLSEELGVAPKTIYRYKKAENPPTAEIAKEIRNYFQKLDREMREREGLRYANESDLPEDEKIAVIYEIYREEMDEQFEEEVHRKVCRQADEIRNGIGYYSRSVQDYIVKNLVLFCEIYPKELELVKRLSTLDRNRYNEAVAYLENIPVDIGMLAAEEDMNEVERIFLYLGKLRSHEVLPKNKYGQIREGGRGSVTKELYDKLYAQLEDLFHCGIPVPADILGRIKVMLDYAAQEWYLLFLYERMLRSDLCDQGVGNLSIGEERVGKKEYMFLRYLEVLGC